MRTTEKELRKFFKRTLNCKVKDVELLRDKRTGRHKGSAYVELARVEDVSRALQASGQVPDFQRFPILVKASEAEKNYIIPASSATLTASMMLGSSAVDTTPLLGPNGKLLESQKVYVGNLDPRVTQEHLFVLFKQFGSLQKVNMQLDPETRQSRGFCFLSFRDPKEANLAIQTMANQLLAGRPLKTGWASQASSIPGVEIVTSEEFPDDATTRIQNALLVLSQLTGGTVAVNTAVTQIPAEAAINAALGIPPNATNAVTSAVPTVAEARALATAQSNSIAVTNASSNTTTTVPADDPKVIGNSDKPTQHLLIRNMFDKDQETEAGWEEDVRLDFEEECTKYGKLIKVVVMSKEPGGKIYASFESIQGAQTCARNLAGRWFDKRQLRVEFCTEADLPEPL
jgi:RNA-binding protein 39